MGEAAVQTALAVGVPTLAVLVGILINNARLNDLRAHMDARLSDFGTRLNDLSGRLNDFNERLNDFGTRLNDLRAHMDARFDDMRETWRAELRRVEEVLDARLKHLEER